LAVVAIALGWFQWGWQGVILAISVVVFWLLLQFSRAMRVMRQAAGAPIGHVDSAVMLNAKLRAGMRLMEIIPLTRSLGQAVEGEPGVPETFTWTDTSGACVRVQLVGGRLRQWSLERPAESPVESSADSPADSPAAAPLTAASDPAPDQASVQASVQAPERGAGA
jgi:hypothetical protein